MALVEFTPNLSRHLKCESLQVEGSNLLDVLTKICRENIQLKSYLLDDQERLRKHVTVFIDNVQIQDRKALSDKVKSNSTVYIAQALSGG